MTLTSSVTSERHARNNEEEEGGEDEDDADDDDDDEEEEEAGEPRGTTPHEGSWTPSHPASAAHAARASANSTGE